MDEPEFPVERRGELLRRVQQRAAKIRWRRRAVLAGSSFTMLLLALVVVSFQNTGPVLTVRYTKLNLPLASAGQGNSQSGGNASKVEGWEPPPGATPPPGACGTRGWEHNFNCGPFRWTPEPGSNRPMSVAVEVIPANPRVDEEVLFRFTLEDDAPPYDGGCLNYLSIQPGGMSSHCAKLDFPWQACPTVFGPWSPPSKGQFVSIIEVRGTFQAEGEVTTVFEFISGRGEETLTCGAVPPNPYSDRVEASVTISIA